MLEAIEQAGSVSRAEVSQRTGLTRATVSALTERLLQDRILEWAPDGPTTGVGRPASPVRLARETWSGLGLEIGANHLCAEAVDLTGARLGFAEVRDDVASLSARDALHAVGNLGGQVWAQAARTRPALRLLGVTLAVPGIVRDGVALDAPRLAWVDVPVGKILDAVAPLPRGRLHPGAQVGNEATLAARAELHARGRETFLYLSGGVGVGGAYVMDGALQEGRHGFAGELGHACVDPAGPSCRCGATGCLEQYAGGEALERLGAREAGRAIGIALAGAVNLLDVNLVVLGGTFAERFDELAPTVCAELERRVLAHDWAPARVERALVRTYPGLRGAALAPVLDVLGDPELVHAATQA